MLKTESQLKPGRNAPRSKTGCNTCLKRKIKCDEQRPDCRRCTSLTLECVWDARTRKPRTVSKVKKTQTSLNPRLSQLSIRPLRSKTEQYEPISPLSSSTDSRPDSPESSQVEVSASPQEFSWFYNNHGQTRLPIPSSSPIFTSSIVPSLSTRHIPCANSLLLSSHDRRCLEYYPSSAMVMGYLKPWRWSNLSYVYQKTASNDAIVMHMILAMSASDMYRMENGSSTATAYHSHDPGLYHYNCAVRGLSVFVGQETAGDEKDRLERLLAALLFMIEYEVRFGYSHHHLRMHLEGIRSLFTSYENLILNTQQQQAVKSAENGGGANEVTDSPVSLLSSQLLLWISYIDVAGGQGLSSQSLLSRMSQSPLQSMSLERIYRNARIAGRKSWAEEYPENEVLDDLENYRPLEFLHHTFVMRSRIWELAVAKYEGRGCRDTPGSLMNDIREIGETYEDLLLTAGLSCAGQHRRVFHTIRLASSGYWAQVLFHRRMLCPHQPRTKFHQKATLSIMQIAHTDFELDKRYLPGHVWALLMAGIDTDDEIHRHWILERLEEFKGVHLESASTSEVLERVIRARKGMVDDNSLDLMPLLRLDSY